MPKRRRQGAPPAARGPRFAVIEAEVPTPRPGRPGPDSRRAYVVKDRQTGRVVSAPFRDFDLARQQANRLNADAP